MKTANRLGVTILELTVVILIVSILASISLAVYTGYLTRARFAVARTEVRELGLNATRHEVDTGWYPLSSSRRPNFPETPYPNVAFGGNNLSDRSDEIWGCGYLTLSLLHGANPDGTYPLDTALEPRWSGPYMTVAREDQGAIDYTTTATYYFKQDYDASDMPASISIKDPWGHPYYYIRHDDYTTMGATIQRNTPFASTEEFYNPSTFQIFSKGPDGKTPSWPDMGTGADDVNNWYKEP